MPRSPMPGDAVCVESDITGNQRNVFRHRLGNQQPVERVFVMERQVGDQRQMIVGDVQPLEVGARYMLWKKNLESPRQYRAFANLL